MAKKATRASMPRWFKNLQCKYCNTVCNRVDSNADAITCDRCTQRLVNGDKLELRK